MDFGMERTTFQDTAQICLNGHLINHSSNSQPIHNKKHCPDCGVETITKCPSCNEDIPGEIHYSNVFGAADYKVAEAFCSNCGKPYPWTERRLKAAKELAAELEISPENKAIMTTSIQELSVNNPQSAVAATRVQKIMSGIGGATADMLKEVIVEVASATAKKVLLGV